MGAYVVHAEKLMPARDKRPTRVCTHESGTDSERTLTRAFEASIFRVTIFEYGVLKHSVMYVLGEGRRALRPEADDAVDIISYSLYRIACKLRYAIVLSTCSGRKVLRRVIAVRTLDLSLHHY